MGPGDALPGTVGTGVSSQRPFQGRVQQGAGDPAVILLVRIEGLTELQQPAGKPFEAARAGRVQLRGTPAARRDGDATVELTGMRSRKTLITPPLDVCPRLDGGWWTPVQREKQLPFLLGPERQRRVGRLLGAQPPPEGTGPQFLAAFAAQRAADHDVHGRAADRAKEQGLLHARETGGVGHGDALGPPAPADDAVDQRMVRRLPREKGIGQPQHPDVLETPPQRRQRVGDAHAALPEQRRHAGRPQHVRHQAQELVSGARVSLAGLAAQAIGQQAQRHVQRGISGAACLDAEGPDQPFQHPQASLPGGLGGQFQPRQRRVPGHHAGGAVRLQRPRPSQGVKVRLHQRVGQQAPRGAVAPLACVCVHPRLHHGAQRRVQQRDLRAAHQRDGVLARHVRQGAQVRGLVPDDHRELLGPGPVRQPGPHLPQARAHLRLGVRMLLPAQAAGPGAALQVALDDLVAGARGPAFHRRVHQTERPQRRGRLLRAALSHRHLAGRQRHQGARGEQAVQQGQLRRVQVREAVHHAAPRRQRVQACREVLGPGHVIFLSSVAPRHHPGKGQRHITLAARLCHRLHGLWLQVGAQQFPDQSRQTRLSAGPLDDRLQVVECGTFQGVSQEGLARSRAQWLPAGRLQFLPRRLRQGARRTRPPQRAAQVTARLHVGDDQGHVRGVVR
ncbi:hypothetical protein QR90_08555 [Deinococcus radiopugnans]|uniref:Uncharacterized protein n=1 Tax=Deinococcus radiopugnans TaxID=57497 RepID=A0A0A7KG67_9DEIO|nr:hypothetical protein QR90_08555 [Deinococcus radiopugnans]